MKQEIEPLAHRFWASKGATAIDPGISWADFDEHDRDVTVWDEDRETITVPQRFPFNQPVSSHTVILTRTSETGSERHFEPLAQVLSAILTSDQGERISSRIRIDAIRFLAKIPAGVRLPTISFGYEEIAFEWNDGEYSVAASVEGDGLVGYALMVDDEYLPGTGPENLTEKELPEDLVRYLREFFND